MNNFFRSIIIEALSIVLLSVTFSCSLHENRGYDTKEVVVLQSAKFSQGNTELKKYFVKKFRRNGVDANILYFDVTDDSVSFSSISTQIERLKPDLLLVKDDLALDMVLSSRSSVFKLTPTVFGGINHLDRENLRGYPLMTGFEDKVDIARNLEITYQIYGSKLVSVSYPESSIEYEHMLGQLSDSTRFAVLDYRMSSSQKQDLYDKYKNDNVIVVDFVHSLESMPFYDAHPIITTGSSMDAGLLTTVHSPQISCVSDKFLSHGDIDVLGGYFVLQQDLIRDMVGYGSSLLKGVNVLTLPIRVHEKDFYLDYKAMKLQDNPLKNKQWNVVFSIENAPLRLSNPLAFSLLVAFMALACIALFSRMRYVAVQRKKIITDNLTNDLSEQQILQKLLVGDCACGYWKLDKEKIKFSSSFSNKSELKSSIIDIEEFKTFIRPTSLPVFDSIYNRSTGFLGNKYLIEATFDSGKSWHWWNFVPVSFDSTKEQIIGVLTCTDALVNARTQIQTLIDRANEVKIKETFLANISQDLRTPLDAITGFAQLLVSEDGFSEQERSQFYDIIRDNVEKMLSLMDNVVEKSRILTSNLSFNYSDISVKTFVEDIYRHNYPKIPQSVVFNYIPFQEDATIRVDSYKLSLVVNSLIAAAFKSRIEGDVSIGWRISPSEEDGSNVVEIFVGETGVVISSFDEFLLLGEDEISSKRNNAIHSLDDCREIVEKQNGSFGIVDMDENMRRFNFRFPSIVLSLLILVGNVTSCSSVSSNPRISRVIASVIATLLVTWFIEKIHRIRDKKSILPLRNALRQIKVLNTLLLQSSGSYLIDSFSVISSIRGRVHPDSKDDFKAIEKAFAAHQELPSLRIKLVNEGDNNIEEENYSWYELRNSHNGIAVLVNIDDIVTIESIHKRSLVVEEQARKKESFIMNVSHEMRTPLNAISGFSQVIAKMGDQLSDVEKREMAGYIRENSTSLINLVTNVLQFSLLESDQVVLTTIKQDPRTILEPIYLEWAQKTPVGVEFLMRDGRDNIVIDVDPTKIKELMDHYLSNAFKFTKSGTIVMGWDYNLDTHEVELYVEDTGCGISQEKVKEVFGLFWKDNEFVPGLGLGLNISKALTELMGGRIHISSQSGVGSKIGSIFPANIVDKLSN